MKFTIPGEPCGKARPRVVHNGNFSRAYTPEKTVNYETLVKLEYQRQCGDAYISEGGIHMNIVARFAIPNSASKRKAVSMADGAIRPTKKPDCDNIIKIVCDALNGIAYSTVRWWTARVHPSERAADIHRLRRSRKGLGRINVQALFVVTSCRPA